MLDYFVSAAVTMLVVLDPPGLAPIFLAVTGGLSAAERRRVAWRSSIIALGILAMFGAVGAPLLAALGITLPAFRIAGGLLLFAISFEMVFGTAYRAQERERRAMMREHHLHRLSVFPLAIPLMAGRSALTAMMLLAGGRRRPDAARRAVRYHCRGGGRVPCRLSRRRAHEPPARHHGQRHPARLLGVVLTALAVQFVMDGIRAAFLA